MKKLGKEDEYRKIQADSSIVKILFFSKITLKNSSSFGMFDNILT